MFPVAVWSSVNIAGSRLRDVEPKIGKPDDPENWEQVHKDVINRCDLMDFLSGIRLRRVRNNFDCTALYCWSHWRLFEILICSMVVLHLKSILSMMLSRFFYLWI